MFVGLTSECLTSPAEMELKSPATITVRWLGCKAASCSLLKYLTKVIGAINVNAIIVNVEVREGLVIMCPLGHENPSRDYDLGQEDPNSRAVMLSLQESDHTSRGIVLRE